MNDVKFLLDIRKRIKSKSPDFIRQDAHKKKGLGKKWRKPKGFHSKMRLKLKGYRRTVSTGYRGPKAVRNLHKSGLNIKRVSCVGDIKKINKDSEGAIIAKSVGQKKRVEILKEAKSLGVRVFNISIDDYLKKVEKIIAEKKGIKEKEGKKEEKSAKKEEKLAEKLQSEEEIKKIEKKEKDKLLTKRS